MKAAPRQVAVSSRTPFALGPVALLAIAVAASSCLPDVPTLGRTCITHQDCGPQNAGYYCARNEEVSGSLCLVGEWPPEPDNQRPVLQSALIVARVGTDSQGVLVAFDVEGDTVRFEASDLVVEGLGTLTLQAAGAYVFRALPTLETDAGGTVTVGYTDRPSGDDDEWVRSDVFIQVVTGLGTDVQEWTGAASSDFIVADNWDPSDQVPDADTSVLIAQTSNPMSVLGNQPIASFFSSPGSRVVLGEVGALTVHGTRLLAAGDVEGGRFVLVSAPELAGTVPGLNLTRGAALVAPLTVNNDLVLERASAGDTVSLGNETAGLALIVRGDVRTAPQSAGFSLLAPGAALIVDGALRLEGAARSQWQQGLVRVGGDLTIAGDGLLAGPGLTVILSGDDAQRLSVSDSTRSRFGNLELSEGTEVTVASDVRITGTFGAAGHLAIAEGAQVQVQGVFALRESFTATNLGGTVLAAECNPAANIQLADFPWITCNSAIDPIDAGPEPDADGGLPAGVEILQLVGPTGPLLAHEATELFWETEGAAACTLDGDPVPVNLGGANPATWPLPYPGNRTYDLTCTNGAGDVASRSVDVVVRCTDVVELTGDRVIYNEANLAAALPPPAGPSGGRVPGRCFSLYGSVIIQSLQEPDLSPLYGLQVIDGHLILTSNQGLTSLRGLDLLSEVTLSMTVGADNPMGSGAGNPELTSLSPLLTVERVGLHTKVGGNAELASLSGLKNVDFGGDVIVSRNNSLRSLAGILRSSYPARLHVHANSALDNPAGLDALTEVQRSLLFEDNDALTSLPLSNLQRVGRRLVIRGHDALTQLDLQALETLGDVPDGQLAAVDGGFIQIPIEYSDGGSGGFLDGGPAEVLVFPEEERVLDISDNGCLPAQVVTALVTRLSGGSGELPYDVISDDNGPCLP